MASFPSPKVHRHDRRKLGRGQTVQQPAANLTFGGSGSTVTITTSIPVVVSDTIPVTYSGGRTITSQSVVSPTEIHQVLSGTITTQTYTYPGGTPEIRTSQGGIANANSGTFA